jgi:hypothetical protein
MRGIVGKMIVLGVVLAVGCKSSGEEGSAGEREGLMMSSDSAACKKAMSCCEKMVEIVDGSTDMRDINLACSGVAMATEDEECDQFREGYAYSVRSKEKELPSECE